MLLFLDFDGVLHHATQGENFIHRQRFEQVLRDYPQIEVVISSSWREVATLAKLRGHFSSDIRKRIIDGTPVLVPPEGWEAGQGEPHEGSFGPYSRYDEIMAWLKSHRREEEPWLALDDTPAIFPPACPNLFLCSVAGLNGETVKRLRAKLSALKANPCLWP